MKVMKKGRSQKGWAKEFRCTGAGNGGGGCGALLLVELGDLFRTYSGAGGEDEFFITFQCVECGVNTDIKQYSADAPPVYARNLPSFDAWREEVEAERTRP